MQLAVDCAGFSGAEADQLRRAMGSKRSTEKMRRLRSRFFDGMAEMHGITGDVARRIYEKLEAFANFGFPESHSQSFAFPASSSPSGLAGDFRSQKQSQSYSLGSAKRPPGTV